MSLIYFVLASYGLTQILVYGSIFNSIRPTRGFFGELFACPMCLGFWVGVLLWCVNPHTELINFDDSYVTALFLGFVSSGTSYVLNMVFDDDGIQISVGGEHETNSED